MIQKLEVQSGLPPGLISSIKKDPKADIVFTTSNNGIVQVGFRNADGTIRVEQYGKKSSGGGGGGWKIEGTGTPESADGISTYWSNAA
jgi:oligoribonuclease NrnB/cAMP/cGMP phosphodiesterase (DHH superfamily)